MGCSNCTADLPLFSHRPKFCFFADAAHICHLYSLHKVLSFEFVYFTLTHCTSIMINICLSIRYGFLHDLSLEKGFEKGGQKFPKAYLVC